MTNYTLALEFDINQITRSLQYEFISEATAPKERIGTLAGTYHFQAGDEVNLSITATAQAQDKIELNVRDCSIVSLSTADLGESYLSLFSKSKAVSRVTNWDEFQKLPDEGADRVKYVTDSQSSLLVKAQNGQWKISGYLSMQIILNGTTYNRVFHFDPEGSTGNGGGDSWPGHN